MNGHAIAYMPDLKQMDSIREGKHEDFTAKRLWELNQHIMGKDAGLLVVFTAFEEKNLPELTPQLAEVFPNIKKTNNRLYLLTQAGKKV